MNKALLDTDIYSEVLRAVNPTVLQNAIAYRQAHGILTLSTVTVMEITRGLVKRQSRRKLQLFESAIALEEVIGFDEAAARLAGSIAGELERVGRPIGVTDPMIAAVALTHGLELLTGNTMHFQRIQQLVIHSPCSTGDKRLSPRPRSSPPVGPCPGGGRVAGSSFARR